MKQFSIPKLIDFSSWNDVPQLSDFSYPWQKQEAPATTFYAYYDESYMHFRFVASGSKPLVFVENNNKMEVIHSERVELFFRSDEKMQPYYCLEIDPHGRILDYRANLYRNFDYNWKWPEPLTIQTKIEDERYIVQSKISLSVLKQLGVLKNHQIQIGLFRGHCTELIQKEATIKWISWIDSKTETPDFHVPSAFGLFLLESRLLNKKDNNK